ncbi:MAG: ABC transporter substrate-binding protein [Rhodoferax sp.]
MKISVDQPRTAWLALCLSLCMGATGSVGAQTTLRDQRGKLVQLAQSVQRVVAIPMPMASVVMTLDQGPGRLVGMHPSARLSLQEGVLGRIFPEALRIPTDVIQGQGFSPNVESLLALKPDAVLQWSQPAAIVAGLENAGLPVIGLTNNPPDQATHESNLRIVGQTLGRTERAEALIARQRAVHAELARAMAELPAARRPRVLYLRAAERSFAPAGRSTFQHHWIELAGGYNVATDMMGMNAEVNAEQIIAWNPQVIFLGSFDHATPAQLLGNKALAGVAAVRDRRVYKLPHGGYRWDPGSQESHLTLLWAAQLLQPGRLPNRLRQSMRDEYMFLYGHRLDETMSDEILQLPLNQASAGYDAFRR